MTAAPDMSWVPRAACIDDPHPECWFAGPGDHDARMRALHICLSCPVRAECLEYALCHERNNPELASGMAGGLTPNARIRLLRSQE